jgi:hypothetical protein
MALNFTARSFQQGEYRKIREGKQRFLFSGFVLYNLFSVSRIDSIEVRPMTCGAYLYTPIRGITAAQRTLQTG